jgi:antitoxin MazE
MHTKVQKWGNSLALRIPNSFIKDTGLTNGSDVDVSVQDGMIVVRPEKNNKKILDELLKKITKVNLHREIDSGQAVGGEFR